MPPFGTGAVPVRPPVAGLDGLGPADGVHLLHSMDDTFAVMRTLEETGTGSAVIVGAGYVGLEMAEALSSRPCSIYMSVELLWVQRDGVLRTVCDPDRPIVTKEPA